MKAFKIIFLMDIRICASRIFTMVILLSKNRFKMGVLKVPCSSNTIHSYSIDSDSQFGKHNIHQNHIEICSQLKIGDNLIFNNILSYLSINIHNNTYFMLYLTLLQIVRTEHLTYHSNFYSLKHPCFL